MATRKELFQVPGSFTIEALAMLHLEEANRVRKWLGRPKITKQQAMDEMANHMSSMEPYK